MDKINPLDWKYRQMLANLDKLISPRELSVLKFQCKALRIGDRNRDRIESSLDLWEKLEERGLLGVDNLSFLKELLQNSLDNRQDVTDVISQFEKYRHVDTLNGSSVGQEDLSKEIHFLVENLGRDWKFFIRALGLQESKLDMCIESHPRNVREQIHAAFKEWKKDCNPKKSDILRALKEIHRNDLHHKISKGLP